MCKMQCVNGSASPTSWTNQLDGPAGLTSFFIWSRGQFAYSKIFLSVYTLSQLPCTNITFKFWRALLRSMIFFMEFQFDNWTQFFFVLQNVHQNFSLKAVLIFYVHFQSVLSVHFIWTFSSTKTYFLLKAQFLLW